MEKERLIREIEEGEKDIFFCAKRVLRRKLWEQASI
jgi:hypothetical protein